MLFSAYGNRSSDIYACLTLGLTISARDQEAAATATSSPSAATTFNLHLAVDITGGAVGAHDEVPLWAAPPRSAVMKPHPLWQELLRARAGTATAPAAGGRLLVGATMQRSLRGVSFNESSR
ncbi:hypothetical protein CHLRE_17g725700v5 [Chlamydomonas reinhardtii]|uniref:Uncharacterized protein n=1 Tax=Chlamydomonas reinhardtii TaxID=3055 RepID=A0A2K3CQL6_CHLRE|nr:uncharacterized protein CHLRE_17g725700v5 [Chlamydomonas reinhardtii]XP_042914798.1 uncharacterized protein CHLRE_17g725700v5 [Chlamydomonas reinhardtii]XP_042914799.1 uncharacterized protein CHLRE_17g725700v5 [Chlamydomonas reinhardtii]PNW70577.1 hypothetical protein CHLRE_17g725700v5 [Chlamydomonas reinhardtii]PNW70578.1 hypothetical protein CHLRE_17g725700v5 [Chlamydomonas reinhardtii]PNW70579.1 hypothetical protein CHLRE_17g725700v5 [Chlamydomonas reinhardtii]